MIMALDYNALMYAANRFFIRTTKNNEPMKRQFSKRRIERLKKDTQDFRDSMEERLISYFKDRPVEEVIKIIADWISLDDLLDLTHRVSMAEQEVSEKINPN